MNSTSSSLPGTSVDGDVGRIEVRNLGVVFEGLKGRTQALAETTVTFEAGSFNALVGPTGCGKSTFLNVIAGFVAPTSGSVEVDGVETLRPGPDRGVVFQQYALMPWLTARGNVEFALKRFRLPRDERRRRGDEELERVGLGHASSHYPAELSGGMQQRVGLARTLAGEPKVLLMDEPFGALDAQTRLTMQQLLLDLWETNKITVVFVTHDVDEALVLSDEVYVMAASPGRITRVVDVGTPRPRSVEDFGGEHVRLRKEILQLLRH